ncbi:glyoxylase-like metal-dependent hydrolase (beta-lactamase superfamily II) [Stackebrandtia albiflava]|uniref:Glyoxylase-like metal-dependent hydrolase (Beta-lactamase superfamily II) n=1 Tax=Stackebrandtia albiflava TaxID=406432 RepID=A0A562URN8_9ACTN|nr:MBL fold metallo-hydrolase [Stackebrandtia albiflava]TWJ08282.1 glyoxylase-like metal-dependent hydrolase (beta-lactamase superfamily II) [Stackebrandtia albiflava]
MAELHIHTAGEAGLFVNSYIWETETGTVLIDTGLLVSDIAALKERLARIARPLRAVFVTHAHPDHFNGVHDVVGDTGVPVYATGEVTAAIREIADAKRAQWAPVYGDEWPPVTAYPTAELTHGQALTFDELTLTVHTVGKAESHADSLFTVTVPGRPPAVFVGDLAFHGTHPYTADGHSGAWLAALDRVAAEVPAGAVLYPGHGAPGDVTMLDAQRRYLTRYREEVARLAAGATTLTEDALAELEKLMTGFLPDAPLTWMIGLGANAVAAELNGVR